MKRTLLFILPPLLFISGFYLRFVMLYPLPPDQGSSDLLVSHLPNLLFLQHWLQQGILPLWSDAILSGYPFFANPLSGLWYLPGWLMLLFPNVSGVNLVIWLHLAFAGWGMFLFLRQEGYQPNTSVIGAVSFMLLPKIAGHYGVGHISLIFSMSYLPWLLWSVRRTMTTRSGTLLAALFWGFTILADVRWAAYAALLWGGYQISLFVTDKAAFSWRNISGRFLPILLGCGVSAVLILPMLEYTGLSTRVLMTEADRLLLALPPNRLFGVIVPDFGGLAEWQVYAGGICAAFALWSVFQKELRRRNWFWWTMVVFSLVFATGVLPLIYHLPGINLLRVPARILALEQFSLIVIFISALDALAVRPPRLPTRAKMDVGLLVVFLVGALVLALGVGVWLVSTETPVEFLWGGGAVLAGLALLLWLKKSQRTAQIALLVCCVLVTLDLGLVGRSMLEFRFDPYGYYQDQTVMKALQELTDKEPFRVYSPSYSIPQYLSAPASVEMADGIDPLQLLAYAAWMENATGVAHPQYAVSIPPFYRGEPSREHADKMPNAELMGQLNVRYIVSAFPLHGEGLKPRAELQKRFIYENELWLPRFRLITPAGQMSNRPVQILRQTPNQIELLTFGPGTLVTAEINYPGWQVQIDDGPLKAIETPEIFRVAEIKTGQHTVRFLFRPVSLIIGCGVSLATLALLLGLTLYRGKRAA